MDESGATQAQLESSQENESATILRIGPWLLKAATGELSSGDEIRHLEPRPTEVLVLLAKNAGRVVTRERFFQEIWGGRAVTDDALTRCIKDLRQCLGDTTRPHVFIETLAKRGYRLICDVEALGADVTLNDVVPWWRRRNAITALVLIVLLVSTYLWLGSDDIDVGSKQGAAIYSLAVLPFKNISGESGQDFLTDGLTEALTAELGKIEGLKVISTTSAMQYRTTGKLIPEIASDLGVEALIEGSVLRAGDEIRITLRLVQGATDQQLWSESYQRDLGSILALYSEVAPAIADEVHGAVQPQTGEKLVVAASAVPRGSQNPLAYEAYLKGRHHFHRFGSQAHGKAMQYYEEAIEHDPGFALAYAGIAETCVLAPSLVNRLRSLEDCEVAALKAVERGEHFAETHAALGQVRMSMWNWDRARDAFERAIKLNPNSTMARVGYAGLLTFKMQYEEAIAEIRWAESLDPLNLLIRTMVGWPLYGAQRFDEALRQWDSVLDMDAKYGLAYWNKGLVYRMRGQAKPLVELSRLLAGSNMGGGIEQQLLEAWALALSGKKRQALEDMAVIEERYGDTSLVLLAELHLKMGLEEEGMDMLERAYELKSPMLVITSEPQWNPWRDHARFMAIRRKMGLP